jgi:hypothetical protein
VVPFFSIDCAETAIGVKTVSAPAKIAVLTNVIATAGAAIVLRLMGFIDSSLDQTRHTDDDCQCVIRL